MKYEQIEKAARDLCTTDRQEQWLKDFGTSCFADGTYDLQYTLAKDTRRWAYVRDLLPEMEGDAR